MTNKLMSDQWVDHDCIFPEVIIGKDDEDEVLVRGMKVIVPCPNCGEEPYSHLLLLEDRDREMTQAIRDMEPERYLFHWSPRQRRKQILRRGLIPKSKAVSSSGKAPYICYADTPAWAWALSGEIVGVERQIWDLWMTRLDLLTDVTLLSTPDRPSGIYEVRSESRCWKRNLWWVGEREVMR